MIVFLFGENKYFILEKVQEIIGEYKKKYQSGLNLLKINTENLDFEDFKNNIGTTSMFKEKKLIILVGLFKDKVFKEKFLDYLKNSNLKKDQESILVIVESLVQDQAKIKALKKDELFTELTKAPVLYHEYKNLTPLKAERWILDFTKKENVKFEKSALMLFISLMPLDNFEFIEKELEKLILYAKAKNNIITKDAVSLMVSSAMVSQNIFQMMDYLGEKKKKEVLDVIDKVIKGGKDELYVLVIIANHIKNLIKMKSYLDKKTPYQKIAASLKIHPFVLKKLYTQAQKFSMVELKNIYLSLFEADLNIKTGKVEPGLALDLFVSKI